MRLASSVAPRILTLSDSARMTAAATLTDLSQDRDLSLCGVPNKIATYLFGLRAMPFSQNQSTHFQLFWGPVKHPVQNSEIFQRFCAHRFTSFILKMLKIGAEYVADSPRCIGDRKKQNTF